LAIVASLIGAGVVLVFSLLLAILLPDSSFLSYAEESVGLLRETMLQAAGTTLSGIKISGEGESIALHPVPLLFFLVPAGGVALGSFLRISARGAQVGRSELVAGCAAGIPFAFLMAIVAFVASGEANDGLYDLDSPVGSTFLLGLCAGVIGGAAGGLLAVRKNGAVDSLMPAAISRYLAIVTALFKPLAVLLISMSLIGAAIWSVQSIRDAADARGDRGIGTAVIDSIAFGGDTGIRNVGLGSFASFKLSEFADTAKSPLPVATDGEKLTDLASDGEFQLFDYKDVLNGWTFVPLAIALIAIPFLLALYAGFLVGRSRKFPDPRFAVVWGLLVGPVWAFSLVILNALSVDMAFGQMLGDSLFASLLLGGAVLGGIGGLLGARSSGRSNHPTEEANRG
jgi:hypothetical protein